MHLLLFPFSCFAVSVFGVMIGGHQLNSLGMELVLVLVFNEVIHFSNLTFINFQKTSSASATTFAEKHFLFTRNSGLHT
jgi:hypothetical protein|tara:strand:+ start:1710 stop:1946 length:237 start_codon:yes stop_codon:yes gene_type:complete